MDDKGKLQSVLNDLYGKNMDTLRNGVSTLLFLRYLFAEYEREARQYIGPEYDDCAQEAKASRAAISPLAVWYERHGEDGSPRTFENWMRRNGNRCVVSPQISWERLVSVAKNDDSVCGFLKMAVDNIHHLNWLSAAVSWDRIGGGVLKRLVMAIDDDCPDGHGVEHCFERALQWFSRTSKRHPFHVPADIAELMGGLALRLPAEYYREVPLYAENLLSFAAGDGTPLAGVLNRLGGVKTIYMQEQDLRERAIACMNLLIHGAGGAGFATSSVHPLRNDWDLFNPNETVGKTLCDVVVAFPHFAETWDSTKYGYLDNRFKRYCPDGMPAQASPELGFLLHGLYFLKPEGTMVMGGVGAMLSRSSIAEKRIRQKLVEYGNLDSVILLPRDTFQHITGMPAALITAETDCPPHDVLFVDARDVTDEILGEPVNDAILNACKYHIETPGFARLVSPAEIRRNDCDLSPDRYIDARMMERTAEPDECCDGPSL